MTAWIAWLVGPAVDLSVAGLLTGMRFLSLHGYTNVQLSKLRRMLRFCGALTLALNTSGALGHQMFGTALVDAVGPALLIGWSEIGPWMLRQIYAVGSMTAATQQGPRSATRLARTLSTDELARARELDAAHRAGTGRPISRDILRDQMRIGRDRAGAIIAVIRTEVAIAEAESKQLRAA